VRAVKVFVTCDVSHWLIILDIRSHHQIMHQAALKTNQEAYLGEKVTHAVVTVPACKSVTLI
jgi:hypothetical protein